MWEFLETYSGAIIAFFTIALVGVTVVYVLVTWKLLRQSRNTLLADIVLRVMETCREEVREVKIGEEKIAGLLMKAWLKSYCETFTEIDKKMGIDIGKLFEVCLGTFKGKLKEKEDLEHPKNYL